MKRVLVIGAGVCGLTSIKSCKEEGIEVVCFEKTGRVGGLWNYHDSDDDDIPSCMKSTIINTSKEMSSFSDFPPPKEFANFMHNRQMLRYFQLYAEKFLLYPHIKLNHEVLSVTQAEDYPSTGRWVVQYKTKEGTKEEIFDGVMICIGHHVKPNLPTFPNQEKFKGTIVHTHSLKVPDCFKDSKVVVVGTGNSGVDAAVEISSVAQQVYLSTRKGFWLVFRVGPKQGLPSDAELQTRFHMLYPKIFGIQFCNTIVESYLNENFDHETYGLKPKHRFFSQHPTLNDHLPEKILNGTVIVKRDVVRFVENGIIFEGDECNVTEIDFVVLATGYNIVFPFLKEEILKVTNNKVNLYKHVFPPDLEHPSLAIIGLIQPHASIFPIAESQSRWFAQLMNGKVKLPSCDLMWKDIRRRQEEIANRYVDSQRHTIQVDYLSFMDDIAEEYGAKPNLLKMAITDPMLFWKCFTGPCLSYQYRLQGPHSWSGARDAIMSYEERLLYPLKGQKGLKHAKRLTSMKFLYYVPMLCAIIFILKFILFN